MGFSVPGFYYRTPVFSESQATWISDTFGPFETDILKISKPRFTC